MFLYLYIKLTLYCKCIPMGSLLVVSYAYDYTSENQTGKTGGDAGNTSNKHTVIYIQNYNLSTKIFTLLILQ